MTYRAIDFKTDIKVDLNTFFAIEPGDGTRYNFGIRQIPNGVMGWSRDEPLHEIVLYSPGGRNSTGALFADHGGTIRDIDIRFPVDDHTWSFDCTRRVALALINYLLCRENPYADSFSGDPAIDGYSV